MLLRFVIKEDEKGRAWNVRDEKCIQNFGWKTKEIDHIGDFFVDQNVIQLKWNFMKCKLALSKSILGPTGRLL
jgi:hypothetical protein